MTSKDDVKIGDIVFFFDPKDSPLAENYTTLYYGIISEKYFNNDTNSFIRVFTITPFDKEEFPRGITVTGSSFSRSWGKIIKFEGAK